MSTTTIARPAEAPAELDRPDAEEIGDEILLAAAKQIKVPRPNKRRFVQPQSRAWTFGGRVD